MVWIGVENNLVCIQRWDGVYRQLLDGKVAVRNPWMTPQFYTDTLQALLNRSSPSLEWSLSSPPKPHAFVSLPVQS